MYLRSLFLGMVGICMGCGASARDGDGGADAPTERPTPLTRTLRFRTAGPLQVAPGAEVPIQVELRDAQGPSPGAVSFALVGAAGNASLSTTRAETSDGIAQTIFVAPTEAATLRLRASAEGAADAFLEIAVSARGFGRIGVTARYTGARSPSRLAVRLFPAGASGGCDGATLGEPVRVAELPPGGGALEFGPLPALQAYTVVGVAEGTTEQLARDCSAGLVVRDGELTPAALSFADLPLRVDQAYELHLALDLGAGARRSTAAWIGSARAALGGRTETDFVLDAVGDAVASTSGAVARAAYAAAVEDHLRAALDADLRHRGASAVGALALLADDAASVIQGADAVGTLLATPLVAGSARLRVSSLELLVDPLTPDVLADDERIVVPVAPAADVGIAVVSPGDRLTVSLAAMPMPMSLLARRALDALLQRMNAGSSAELAQLSLGCEVVAPLLRRDSAMCDLGCIAEACRQAIGRLAHAFEDSVTLTSVRLDTVEVAFEAAARGAPGTLRVASTERAALTGFYSADSNATVHGVGWLETP